MLGEKLGLSMAIPKFYLEGGKREYYDKGLELYSSSLSGFLTLLYTERTEEDLYRDLEEEITEEDVFYDVGAHLGFYSCLAGDLGAQIVSFEPNPIARKDLRINLEENVDKYEVYECGVSDRDSSGHLNSIYGALGRVRPMDNSGLSTFEVEVNALDNIEISSKPDLMKIDVEGMEMKVLKGAREMLKTNNVCIYIEAHSRKMETQVISYLDQINFNIELLCETPENSIIKAK